MNKRECMEELRKVSNGSIFLTVNQVAAAIQLNRGTARQRLYGIPHQGGKTKKLYFIGDIAEKLIECQTSNE